MFLRWKSSMIKSIIEVEDGASPNKAHQSSDGLGLWDLFMKSCLVVGKGHDGPLDVDVTIGKQSHV